MVAITEEKLGKYFSKSFKEVVIPVLEDMEERLASKKDIAEVRGRLDGVESKLDTLDRKFDARQDRLDRHDKRISKLEDKAHFVSS